MSALLWLVRAAFGASAVAALLLTFVWPLAVSSDPADADFRIAAIVTFVMFFIALAAQLSAQLARRR